ncbi:MAG TPA: YggT family protein [Candidatus Dormibacteraeota bacterium]|jgi:uncharacterized protein YggT (Ycf19 family)
MSYQPPLRDSFTDEPVQLVRPVEPAPVQPLNRASVPTYVRMIQLVWFVAGVIDVLTGLRFVLKLLGASTASPFVTLVYGVSAPLVAPFRGVFPVTGASTFVFEPAALVAIVIYPLIALGVASLIRILSQRRTVAT